MFDVLLNAVKIALSDEVRKSTAALLEIIRRSPEWQKEICTVEARIQKTDEEQALLISNLAKNKMADLGYSPETIMDFGTIYVELTRDAYEHGCRKGKGSIKIITHVSPQYIALSVINSSGRRFELEQTVKNAQKILRATPKSPRGRGLLWVSAIADKLTSIGKGTGVKAVVYKSRVVLEEFTIEDVTIITVLDGVLNPSFRRRLIDTVNQIPRGQLVLNLSNYLTEYGTELITMALELESEFRQRQGKVCVLLPQLRSLGIGMLGPPIVEGSEGGLVPLFDITGSHTWHDALKIIDREELLEPVLSRYTNRFPAVIIPQGALLNQPEEDDEPSPPEKLGGIW